MNKYDMDMICFCRFAGYLNYTIPYVWVASLITLVLILFKIFNSTHVRLN